jgi:signal transduction histidine kinase
MSHRRYLDKKGAIPEYGRGSDTVAASDAPDSLPGASDRFNLLRHYAITSFVGVLVAALSLAGLYRYSAAGETTELARTGGIVLVLMLLYFIQLFVVMRAKRMIEIQQGTIRQRTANLETLSVRLLAGAEAEKLHLALDLHEGLAQKLIVAKSNIERSLERNPAGTARDESLATAISALHGAIEEVQDMATELRPSSLDELGLLPTIRWYCREFELLHPDIRIEPEISLQEREIPEELKIVIFRIIEAVLKDIGNDARKDRIRLRLRPNGKFIILAIDDNPQEAASAAAAPGAGTLDRRLRFAAAQERATLSGGAFSAAFNRDGGITLHASWAM